MAVRRPAGFSVPLGFYDGPEVKSIPRRIRAAAVGVWTLCGAFSANKLQDGYVGPETLRELGCTDAIRAALMSTKGPDGEIDPLWEAARDGGIQFTKWGKYQRSRDEVRAWRQSEADRKRAEREAKKGANNGSTTGGRTYVSTTCSSTNVEPNVDVIYDEDIASEWRLSCEDSKMSGRTSAGHQPDLCDPRTETKTKSFSLVDLGGGVTSVGQAVCPRHPNGNPNDEDCRGCGEVRRSAKAYAAAADELAAQRRNRAAAERQAAIDACDICDEHGQIDYGTSVKPCDHGLAVDHA